MNHLYEKYKDLDRQELNEKFINSCIRGDIEDIKYLLTTHELKFNIDFNDTHDEALDFACANNHLEIVKYFLTSPDLKSYISQNSLDNSFTSACFNGNSAIVEYLIYDFDIPYSEKIKSFFDIPNQEATLNGVKINNLFQAFKANFLNIQRMIEARELNKELKINKTKNKKSKI